MCVGQEHVHHQDEADHPQQEKLRDGGQELRYLEVHGSVPMSLVCATWCTRLVTVACITSSSGAGQTPISTTGTAHRPRIRNSRWLMSFISRTWSLPMLP